MNTKIRTNIAVQPTQLFRGASAAVLALALGSLSATAQTSFVDTVDFSDLEHGDIISGTTNLSGNRFLETTLTVTPPSGGFDQAVIFDTQNPDVIQGVHDGTVEDGDLIPRASRSNAGTDFGGIAIIQENTDFDIDKNGRIELEQVDDAGRGGTFSFNLNPAGGFIIDSFQIDLIDVERADQIRIVAFDENGQFEFSGADLQALDSSIVYNNQSANRTSFLSLADTSSLGESQDGIANSALSQITRVDIISSTSFGVDNFTVTAVPEVSSSLLTLLSAGFFCFRRKRKN